jgi:NADH:ubiquinone oxidoreductase subunit 6 (subunit J)
MKLLRILFFPLLAFVTGTIYWALSAEMAGVVMLLVFGGAMTFFMWVLVPTFDHEGNTAPIDPDFTLPEE